MAHSRVHTANGVAKLLLLNKCPTSPHAQNGDDSPNRSPNPTLTLTVTKSDLDYQQNLTVSSVAHCHILPPNSVIII